MRRLPALVAAVLLPAAPPLLLGTATFTGALLVSQAPAKAQSAEAVAKVAQAITVRIEGATQGSGVLVKRDGNRYTVLTAWHVVSGQRPGEELDIYTPDGQRHQLQQGSIKRLGDVDMAVLSFTSSGSYEVASVGDVKSVSSGSSIYVSGYPLPTSAVPSRIFRFMKGDVIANATVAIPDGYQLLYDNQTLPGVSGGAVLNAQGQLVGIHGKAEKADQISESSGKAIATGTNQGVPIEFYKQYASGDAVVPSSAQAVTADDYLAQAASILSEGFARGEKSSEPYFVRVISLTEAALRINPNSAHAYALRARAKAGIGRPREAIDEATLALAMEPTSWNAFFARANAKSDLGDKQGAIADYNQAIAINPQFASAYQNRGRVKSDLGDKQGAIADYNQAIAINPQFASAYESRGNAKSNLGDKQGAIADYTQAIAINPQFASAYALRGSAKHELGDKQGAILDYSQAIAINPQLAAAYGGRGYAKYALGDKQGALDDFNRVIAINPQLAEIYHGRGYLKNGLGDKRGAIADYSQAIAINPQLADAYINRGDVKSSLGDIQGAIADYSQAIAISPQNAPAYVNRASSWQKLGNATQMCEDLAVASRLGSSASQGYYTRMCR